MTARATRTAAPAGGAGGRPAVPARGGRVVIPPRRRVHPRHHRLVHRRPCLRPPPRRNHSDRIL